MRRILGILVALAIVGAAVFWWVTRPQTAEAAVLNGIEPDVERGRTVFIAGGCASCHSAPKAEGEDKLRLTGGRNFISPFGTFYAPNISPHETAGIGGWSALNLYNAMHHGVSPEGQHYFPAFPYTSYVHVTPEDVVSLHAYLQTLPPVETASRAHDVGFPFNIRRSLGGWKFLFAKDDWVLDGDLTEQEAHGRYLSEALGHCGECHTPRNVLGGLNRSKWMGGAPNPSGEGKVPNITPGKLKWSESDLSFFFSDGMKPDFDSAGGEMADVIRNLQQLTDEDRAAITAYMKKLPPIE